MNKQLRFLVVREDFDQFMKFAEREGFRAVPVVIETDTVPESRPPTDPRFEHNHDFFYLLPRAFADVEAFYDDLPFDPGLSKIMDDSSPVIEVSPANVSCDHPVEGRIYHCQTSDDPRFEVARKAYERLAGFLTKWPKSADGRFHVGPCAALIEERKKRSV